MINQLECPQVQTDSGGNLGDHFGYRSMDKTHIQTGVYISQLIRFATASSYEGHPIKNETFSIA